jgi:uncharacterized membrane protein YkvA (DUF1232 family)
MSRFLASLKEKARALKRETTALWFALRDPRTPWPARMVGAMVVAYALSPIDLIPDFIPVLGLLDDLILLPLGIALCVRLIPAAVFEDARRRAIDADRRPANRSAAVVIALIWIGLVVACGLWAWQKIR